MPQEYFYCIEFRLSWVFICHLNLVTVLSMSEEFCWDFGEHCQTYKVLAQGRAIDPSLWENVPLVYLCLL